MWLGVSLKRYGEPVLDTMDETPLLRDSHSMSSPILAITVM